MESYVESCVSEDWESGGTSRKMVWYWDSLRCTSRALHIWLCFSSPALWLGGPGARQADQAGPHHHVCPHRDGGACQGRGDQDAGGGSQECQRLWVDTTATVNTWILVVNCLHSCLSTSCAHTHTPTQLLLAGWSWAADEGSGCCVCIRL